MSIPLFQARYPLSYPYTFSRLCYNSSRSSITEILCSPQSHKLTRTVAPLRFHLNFWNFTTRVTRAFAIRFPGDLLYHTTSGRPLFSDTSHFLFRGFRSTRCNYQLLILFYLKHRHNYRSFSFLKLKKPAHNCDQDMYYKLIMFVEICRNFLTLTILLFSNFFAIIKTYIERALTLTNSTYCSCSCLSEHL